MKSPSMNLKNGAATNGEEGKNEGFGKKGKSGGS